MKKFIGLYGLIIVSFLSSCIKNSGDPVIDEKATITPSIAELKLPENGLVCFTARPNNADYAEVDFQWTAAENADYYELQITNLIYDYVFKERITGATTKTYTLLRGNPYSWKIIAYNSTSKKSSETTAWKFYLNSDGVRNYAPFAAEIIAPASGKTVSPINGNLIFEWKGLDPDNDDLHYEVYLSETREEVLNLTVSPIQSSNSKIEIPVKPNSTYYWRIKSMDQESSSYSSIYGFRTK